ncbi:MAG: phosphoglycerate kinase [Chlamydiota bacterium]
MMTKLTLNQLDVHHKKVLLRVDFNVPLESRGVISDDTRIQAALPSIHSILNRHGKLIIMSHLGRPKGQRDPSLSLAPCATRLSELINSAVGFATDCIGQKTLDQVNQLLPGKALVLENLRFHPEEESPSRDNRFAADLAALGEAYVNDAFGTAHRNHSSIVSITQFFKKASAMGLLMEKEINMLSHLVTRPKSPFSLVLGGAKLSTKIGLLKTLLPKIHALFIGGGMAFTFLKAQGIAIGDSICDETLLPQAEKLIAICRREKVLLYLPKDVVIGKKTQTQWKTQTVEVKEGIPAGWQGMDIGPKTVSQWKQPLLSSATIFWNGPMGVFEISSFAAGTVAIATILSQADTTVIAGGGDSLAAIKRLQLDANFTHLSTGGGASLAYLEYGHLPGIDALSTAPSKKNPS